MRTIMGLCLVILVGLGSQAADVNWPQFRGPHASGVAEVSGLPLTWDIGTGENVAWRIEVPGLAHSSPIIWGDRIYVTTAVMAQREELKVGLYGDIGSVAGGDPVEWRLLSFGKQSGRLLSSTVAHQGVPRLKRHPKSTHCNPTPATDGRRIAAIFGSEGLFCFDMQGKLVWQKDLGPMEAGFFAVPTAHWGFASSPVIHEGKVIVLCDVLNDSFLAAFDLRDGREVWRTPRKDVPTWGTPTVIESAGHQQIVVNGWHRSGGYDLTNGRELWWLDGGGDIPVPTPVTGHGLVFLTSAHGNFRPIRGIWLEATGNITPSDMGSTNAAIAWCHPRQGNYMQTPILVGQLLFACTDWGVLSCFDAMSGKVHYSERLGSGSEGFTASPVAAQGRLYFASEPGRVFVVAADPKFSVIATNNLGETCMATAALTDGKLLFRTREHLVALSARR